MLAPQAHGKGLELLPWIDDDVPAIVRGDRHSKQAARLAAAAAAARERALSAT